MMNRPRLKPADVTRFFNVVGFEPLPEHIWSRVKDPFDIDALPAIL